MFYNSWGRLSQSLNAHLAPIASSYSSSPLMEPSYSFSSRGSTPFDLWDQASLPEVHTPDLYANNDFSNCQVSYDPIVAGIPLGIPFAPNSLDGLLSPFAEDTVPSESTMPRSIPGPDVSASNLAAGFEFPLQSFNDDFGSTAEPTRYAAVYR